MIKELIVIIFERFNKYTGTFIGTLLRVIEEKTRNVDKSRSTQQCAYITLKIMYRMIKFINIF